MPVARQRERIDRLSQAVVQPSRGTTAGVRLDRVGCPVGDHCPRRRRRGLGRPKSARPVEAREDVRWVPVRASGKARSPKNCAAVTSWAASPSTAGGIPCGALTQRSSRAYARFQGPGTGSSERGGEDAPGSQNGWLLPSKTAPDRWPACQGLILLPPPAVRSSIPWCPPARTAPP